MSSLNTALRRAIIESPDEEVGLRSSAQYAALLRADILDVANDMCATLREDDVEQLDGVIGMIMDHGTLQLFRDESELDEAWSVCVSRFSD